MLYNYLYKGPVLEWYFRVKLALEKNYTVFHQLVPSEGRVLDIGCGYGFLSYMLHFTAQERIITGIDYDEEKIATANHCFSRTPGIDFEYADVLHYRFEQYDAILLSDVLHYLQPVEQKEVVEKCLRHLNAGGTLIIRDGNKDLEERHKGTKLTEFFSTRFIGFNKTSGKGLSFLSGADIHNIAAAHGVECNELDSTKYTSNIIFVIKKPGI